MTKVEEIYVPEEQKIITDDTSSRFVKNVEKVAQNLTKEFIVAKLDCCADIDEFMKIDIAHAVGVLEGEGRYKGIGSSDKTWLYEFEEKGKRYGGVAIVRYEEVIDLFPIWESSI